MSIISEFRLLIGEYDRQSIFDLEQFIDATDAHSEISLSHDADGLPEFLRNHYNITVSFLLYHEVI